MWLVIIILFLLPNLIFSQNIDDLVYLKSLPAEKVYFFDLEKVLLIDSYDFKNSYYTFGPIDVTEIKVPEYANSESILFNVYDERKSIQSIPQNNFDHLLISKNSSDYLSSKIGTLEFLDNGLAIFDSTPVFYSVLKVFNKDSFGNLIYILKLSSSQRTIELPIYRVSGSYKLVLSYLNLNSLGIKIIEKDIIPFKAIFNNRIIVEQLDISSVRYELSRNSNYFESYRIEPSIHNIVRIDLYNDSFLSKVIPKDDILFIFDLQEGL